MRIENFLQVCTLAAASVAVLFSVPSTTSAYGQATYYNQNYYQSTYYSQSYYQGYYQGAYQSSYQTTFTDNTRALLDFSVASSVSKSSGTFVIDHPLDPINKLLYHSFVESPDVKNFYDGIVSLDGEGRATVWLPTYFETLNKDYRYQVKPVGDPMPNLHISTEVADNTFTIAGGMSGGTVSWQITGVRKDPYILKNPIIPEVDKGPGQPVNKGEYLYPEGFSNSFFGSLTSFLGSLFSRLWGGS